VTELSGLEAFNGFFGEAWTFGISDNRPMSILLARLGETDEQTLKLIAQKIKTAVGRSLDLAARIDEWEFGLILPDTDLDGALAVAGRLRDVMQDEKSVPAELCYSVVSIVPNANGNAKSFLEMCHRALAGAHLKGDGQIVYVNDQGKLTLYSQADVAVAASIDADATVVSDPDSNPDTDATVVASTSDYTNIINWDAEEEASG